MPQVILDLPDIQGAGEVVSLRRAMMDDTTGALQGLVEDFVEETDALLRQNIFHQILYQWAEVGDINPASRGGLYDAQKLAVIERFVGLEFEGDPEFSTAITWLDSSYGELFEVLYANLLSQTHLSGLISLVDEDASGTLIFDGVVSEIDDVFLQDANEGTLLLSEFSRVIRFYNLQMSPEFLGFRHYYATQSEDYARAIDFTGINVYYGTAGADTMQRDMGYDALDGGEGDDWLHANTTSDLVMYGGAGVDFVMGSLGDDLLLGNDGDDVLEGKQGRDVMYGGAGSDLLSAGVDDDILTGGAGDDTLYGGAFDDWSNLWYTGNGNDTYVYNTGDGTDTIIDYDNTLGNIDTIKFGSSIAPEDVIFTRPGTSNYATNNQLEITFVGSPADKIIIKDFFQWYSRNETSQNTIERFVFSDGTVLSFDDVEAQVRYRDGTEGDDEITGLNGVSNVIYGNGGFDAISGQEAADMLYGGDGDDTIFGAYGSDVLEGGTGNDFLNGGSPGDSSNLWYTGNGNDTYIYNIGDGVDTISDYDNTGESLDIIEFGQGITPADVIFTRPVSVDYAESNQLEITFVGNSVDKIIIKDYFLQYYGANEVNPNTIELYRFASGLELTPADVAEQVKTRVGGSGSDEINATEGIGNIMYGHGDTDYLTGSNMDDYLYGGPGGDVLAGNSGNDNLYGEADNDTLYGSTGDDLLDGGAGNDALYGGQGDDMYIFDAGDGVDAISEDGGVDLAQFGYSADSIIFEEDNGSLYIKFAGSTDEISVYGWFWNNSFQIDEIKSSDDNSISSNQIELLIQAMATYSSQNNGISWQDALQQNPQDVQTILSQFWVPSS